jgi:uncharacterized membrane protein YgaE (UPF0421/DUF939 family)
MMITVHRRIIRYGIIFFLVIASTPIFYLFVRFGLPMWGVAVGMLGLGVFGEIMLYRELERYYLKIRGRRFKDWRELEHSARAENQRVKKSLTD